VHVVHLRRDILIPCHSFGTDSLLGIPWRLEAFLGGAGPWLLFRIDTT
jgi:hypothetical protein